VGASVVTSVDAPPILEFAEHVLDFVAAAVEHLVVRDGHFSIGLVDRRCLDRHHLLTADHHSIAAAFLRLVETEIGLAQ
jgi:hypothetical protein